MLVLMVSLLSTAPAAADCLLAGGSLVCDDGLTGGASASSGSAGYLLDDGTVGEAVQSGRTGFFGDAESGGLLLGGDDYRLLIDDRGRWAVFVRRGDSGFLFGALGGSEDEPRP